MVRGLTILIAAGLLAVLVFGLSVALPPGLGPDEPPHLRYAGYLALEGRLPDLQRTPVAQAQHPPLYHATVGLLYSAAAGDVRPPAGKRSEGCVLPYERRVVLDLDEPVPDQVALLGAEAAGRPPQDPAAVPHTPRRTFYVLRWSGILFGLLSAWVILTTVPRLLPDRSGTALLAAALVVLVPQFGAIFATVNNDQFAVLFGTLGFAVLARGAAAGRLHTTPRLLAAGVCYAAGFLSKLHVAGPFVAGLVLVWGWTPRPPGRRLRALALMGLLPLVAAGTWVGLQMMANGSPHALEAAARHHPGLLRVTPPDGPALLNVVGRLGESWLGSVGRDALDPGELWGLLAASIPLLLLASCLVVLFGRDMPRRDRLLVWAFAAGLAVQLGGILYGNLRFVHSHGRYLHALALPGALALAAAVPHLLGRRAAAAVGLQALLAAAGGLILLHGRVLPTYHAGHGIQEVPGLEAYVDLGRREPDPRAGGGVPGHDPNSFYPRPSLRWRASRRGGELVEVAFEDLEAQGFHVLSMNLHPTHHAFEHIFDASLDVLADGAQTTGFWSPFSRQPWPSFPVPRSAVADGSFRAIVRPQSGVAAGVSELLLRRLPLRYAGREVEEDHVVVRFQEDRPAWCSPDYQVRLLAPEGPLGGPAPLGAPGPHGARMVRLPLPDPGTGRLELLLQLPQGLYMDVKASALALPEVTVTGDPDVPGLFYADLRPGRDLGRTVARIPAVTFRPGSYRFRFVDGAGRPVRSALVVRPTGGPEDPGEPVTTLTVSRRPDAERMLDVVYRGTSRVRLDRIQALARSGFIIDLRLER